MRKKAGKRWQVFGLAMLCTGALPVLCAGVVAQQQSVAIGEAQQQKGPDIAPPNPAEDTPGEKFGKFFQLPVSGLVPGDVHPKIDIKAPENDPQAVERGMKYFTAFNCVGCHAANGGGGMGPSLSNNIFIYGGSPGNIYMTLVQGRPRGMPAWGTVLPDNILWDLVAYVRTISNAPSTEWGQTFSKDSPKIEQVPAEFQSTPTPWKFTQPFMKGQQPKG
jgi:cytochrome c oxidase cbb3-type subunit III